MMHEPEKSDSVVVAGKPTNKAERSATEPVEPRTETKGNANQQSTHRTQSRASVTQALERIRKAASKRKKERFTALFHHISVEHLEAAFFELQENAAAGVDGLTWRAYEADLECNLEELHGRLHRGRIGRCRHGGSTFPSRMDDGARSPLLRWKTRSSSERRQRCSTRSTRKTSSGSRMDSGPGAARMMRWMRWWSESKAGR